MIEFDTVPCTGEHAYLIRARWNGAQVGCIHVYAHDSTAGIKSPCYGDPWISEMMRSICPSHPFHRFVVCSSDATYRGQGLGVELYVLAAQEAARRGGYLAASACVAGAATSEDARRVWSSRRLARRVRVFGMVAYAG